MKKIKTLFIATVIFVLCVALLSGCGKILPREDASVKILKKELSAMAKESAKTYFNQDIDINDFDISIAEKTGEDTFETLETTNTINEVHLMGHHKGKPENVINFILSYDVKNKDMIKFGLQTTKDEKV